MKSKIILLLLTFALVTNIYAELKNNKTTLKVELTNVLQINQTKEIKAKFTDLTACIKISLSTLTLIFCGGNIC
jgi:hypothetical protein